jgi:hypothetical protein
LRGGNYGIYGSRNFSIGKQLVLEAFQGILACSYNYLKVNAMKTRSSHHSLPIICEKTHKECHPFHAQTITQA